MCILFVLPTRVYHGERFRKREVRQDSKRKVHLMHSDDNSLRVALPVTDVQTIWGKWLMPLQCGSEPLLRSVDQWIQKSHQLWRWTQHVPLIYLYTSNRQYACTTEDTDLRSHRCVNPISDQCFPSSPARRIMQPTQSRNWIQHQNRRKWLTE